MAQVKFKYGTWAQYSAITSKDNDTLYFITDKGVLYKGDTAFAVAYSSITTNDSGEGEKSATTVTLTDQLGNTVRFAYPNGAALTAVKNALQGQINTHKAVTGDADDKGHVMLSDDTDSDSGVSGGKAATPKAVKDVKEYIMGQLQGHLAANDAMVFKGTLGTAGTVAALPTTGYSAGWTYKVIKSTNYTYAGKKCEEGDLIIAVKDFSGTFNNDDWTVVQTNIDGAVTGPDSVTTNTVAIFNGETGKVIKSSGMTIGKSVPTDAIFTDTTYTFKSGNSGSFQVTPKGGSAQTVSIGKPGTAGTADKVANTITVKLNGGTAEGTNKFTFDGSGAKSVDITPEAIGALKDSDLEWGQIGG